MQTTSLAIRVIAGLGRSVSLRETPEAAMTFELEEDFEHERWRLLALVDGRKNLSDESEGAIKTDLEIVATRELIRTYETLKGYWSQKAPHRGHKGGRHFPQLECSESSQRSGSDHAGAGKR
jgi:hypothetical protein